MEPQVKNLSLQDSNIIKGFDDPYPEEPEQLIPPTPVNPPLKTEEEEKVDELRQLKQDCLDLIADFKEMIKEVDKRCAGLEVKTGESLDSSLAQSMYRTFGVRSTVITYDQYKKALELQSQLSAEDREKLRQM